MILTIENCDFYEDALIDVVQVLNEIINNENKTYDDIKRARNILDDLSNFNLTFMLEDVDMVVYTMLLSMKNISCWKLEGNMISFKELNFPNEGMENEYIGLISKFVELSDRLKEEYEFNELDVEYLAPNSKLSNIKISCSIKDLIYFILSCAKYDELIDINVLFSEYDKLMESIVTVAMSSFDITIVDDLFIRMRLDDENRRNMLDAGNLSMNIISNEEYISHCIKTFNSEVKLSTIGTSSLVAYREVVNNIPKQDIKIENFNDFINQEYFSISLPCIYGSLDDEIANEIEKYIYDWYVLINQYKEMEDYKHEQLLCCLNCFEHIFKMNTQVYNYFNLDVETELTEVKELMRILKSKLMEE